MRTSTTGTLRATIEIGGEEVDIHFDYLADSGCAASYHPWHGWSPPEPPYVEIGKVTRDDTGAGIEDLSDADGAHLEDLVWEHLAQLDEPPDEEDD